VTYSELQAPHLEFSADHPESDKTEESGRSNKPAPGSGVLTGGSSDVIVRMASRSLEGWNCSTPGIKRQHSVANAKKRDGATDRLANGFAVTGIRLLRVDQPAQTAEPN
jgi:hypothetical protein